MKRITFFIVFGVLTGICAAGQSASQMSVFGTFGVISGAMYAPAAGNSPSMEFGYGGGFNYTYFFRPSFGLTFGAEVLTYNSKYDLAEFPIGDDPAHDGEESFRLKYTLKNYTESQSMLSALIPVMLTFETSGRKVKFFVSAGGKLNIMIKSEYTGLAENIETYGYYPQYELNLKDIKWMGFGSNNPNIRGKGKLPLRTISPVLAAEMGMKIMLSRDWALYLGGYIDYGLGLFNKADASQAFVQYNTLGGVYNNYSMNTVLYSHSTGDKVFVDEMMLMSAGVKFKVACNTAVISSKPEPKSMEIDFLADAQKGVPVVATPLSNEAPPSEVKEQVQQGKEDNVPLIIKRKITFGLKSFALPDKQKKILDDKARVMENNPELKITIRGNANDYFDKKVEKQPKLRKSAESKNKKLSLQRAKAIRDYLVSKGISGSRIKTIARGSKSPLVPNTTPRNRAKNRRADFVMTGKK